MKFIILCRFKSSIPHIFLPPLNIDFQILNTLFQPSFCVNSYSLPLNHHTHAFYQHPNYSPLMSPAHVT